MHELRFSEQEQGQTLLQALRQQLPAAPIAYLRQLLRHGRISGPGPNLDEDSLVQAGDGVWLPESGRMRDILAQSLTIRSILLEDEFCLVMYKPAGLAVHSSLGHAQDNLTDRLRRLMKERGVAHSVAPVHRLDIGTSGPVLFGKGRQATRILGRMMMDGRMTKHYLALVAGRPPQHGRLEQPVVAKGKVREAATIFEVAAYGQDGALLRLQLVTGRKHQIRQQLAAAGWPLIGDERYGGPPLNGLQRPFLHCCELVWPTFESISGGRVCCPLPGELSARLPQWGIEPPPGLTNRSLPGG
jgi:RluA family pseudouridine synthase